LLLSVLEDGYLTDASGVKINFTNTIIIMTSNLGSQFYNGQSQIGFGDGKAAQAQSENVLGEVKKWFKPEFINRLDKVICFNNLNPQHLAEIIELKLEKLSGRISRDKGYDLAWKSEVIVALVQKTLAINHQDGNRGARIIRSIIRDEVETPLADMLLRKKMPPKKTLRLNVKNGIISLT